MNWIIALVTVYVLLCFVTAYLLTQTPYSEVGFFYNALFAPAYWLEVARGRL